MILRKSAPEKDAGNAEVERLNAEDAEARRYAEEMFLSVFLLALRVSAGSAFNLFFCVYPLPSAVPLFIPSFRARDA